MSDATPRHLIRQEAAEIVHQAEEEEKTWKPLEIFGHEIALMPNGGCHWWKGNATYPSLHEAVEAVRERQIDEWRTAIKTYGRIVKDFDEHPERKYDEYFTEKRIQYFRELLTSYPQWLAELEAGKFIVKCAVCDKPSIWVDHLDFDNLPLCECGKPMRYC